jgi:hypothetical protein
MTAWYDSAVHSPDRFQIVAVDRRGNCRYGSIRGLARLSP